MDQHRKQIKAQVAELTAETKRLAEEKEAAIREKHDYTINQERLVENIRCDLEREYADKEQNYLKQLKDEMRAIRDQYKTKLNQEIEKLKVEWTQEHLKTNEQHNAQISQVLKEVEALKEQSRIQPNAESDEPGEKISGLKSAAFKEVVLLTSTMTQSCGVKTMMHHQFHHANRMKNTSISQVHHAIQYNLTSLILMTKIPSLVIQGTRSSVTLAIHLCNNRSIVKSQHKPR